MKHIIIWFFILSFSTSLFISCNKSEESAHGSIVFWNNGNALDCFNVKVKISIDGHEVEELSRFYDYNKIPECGAKNCITVDIEEGIYNYSAICFCNETNEVGYWSGTIDVKIDSCSKVFLDVFMMKR